MGAEYYQIDADRCTECIGHYDRPTCQQVCPIDHTIIADPQRVENSDALWEKFVLLRTTPRGFSPMTAAARRQRSKMTVAQA